jgi:GntR family transcriptional regulator/MocR family aminotransferase
MARRTNPAPARGAAATTLRQQVYERLRESIVSGALKPGARLPPSREHAEVLGVSRNTVVWAVQRLRFEGYVASRVGDGTYVSNQAQGFSAAGRSARVGRPPGESDLSRRGRLLAGTHVTWGPRPQEACAFRMGAPAIEAFPFATWDRLTRQTSDRTQRALAGYLDAAGHPPLRAAIAEFLAVSRGIHCNAEQVIVTSGSQQAIDLVCRLLLDDGDEVLVEDPGYLGLRANVVAQGARAFGVAVDGEGLDIAQAARAHPKARLVIATPTHQYPLGVTMSLARRVQLIAWAQKQRAWVIEDDYDGEFQYAGRSMPALCSIDRSGRVLYVGTFSKILHPGLRLGYIVLPAALADPFRRAKAVADRHSPAMTQDILARFISEGHMVRHLRAMRELYHERQRALVDALATATDGRLVLAPSATGMHLVHEVSPHVDDLDLTRRAAGVGVEVAPLSVFCLDATRRGWMFGYAGFDATTLADAARRIGRWVPQADGSRPG